LHFKYDYKIVNARIFSNSLLLNLFGHDAQEDLSFETKEHVQSDFPSFMNDLFTEDTLKQYFEPLCARKSPIHCAAEVLSRPQVWTRGFLQPLVEVGIHGREYSSFVSGIAFEKVFNSIGSGGRVAPFVLFSDGKIPTMYFCMNDSFNNFCFE
jgi:hypothetical protein